MRIIGGRLSGRRFGAPAGKATRPTSDRVREGLGSALASRGAFDGANVLDLFAGSGALSFEALSRGAHHAVLVDNDPRVLRDIKKSANELGLIESVRTVRADLSDPETAAKRIANDHPFDLVFVDAPYASIPMVPPIINVLRHRMLLAVGAFIVVEHPTTHSWHWTNGLASEAEYRYGQTRISLGVYQPKGTK